MINANKQKLTLDRPTAYQIKVPGHLDERWSDWVENMKIEIDDDEIPITILTCKIDQAALLGLLRRLNSLGLPLISVKWLGKE